MISIKKIGNGLQYFLKSSLFRSSALYTVSSFVNASIPFLLLPFLTKALSNQDFGIVTMFMTVLGFLMPFVGLSMEGAIARKYYDKSSDFNQYVGNCILISCVLFAIVSSIIYVFGETLYQYTFIHKEWMFLAVILCFSKFLTDVLLTIFQMQVKPLLYGALQISQSVLNIGLSIILVIGVSMKWEGRIIAQIASGVIFGIISIFILISKLKISFKLNTRYIKHALKFGGGLVPHALGGLLIILTNRFFILNMIGIDETGLYGAASQIANVLGFITLSFNNAFVPWLYQNLTMDSDVIRRKIVKLTYYYFGLITLSAIVYYFITPIVFSIFINDKFFAAQKYLIWIIFGFAFQGMYFMVTNYISYAEKTHYQAFITLFVGVFNIGANYVFIKIFGAVGAAMAFCMCFLLLFILTWILSAKVYKMPWFPKKIIQKN